jgi:hypothetical protein
LADDLFLRVIVCRYFQFWRLPGHGVDKILIEPDGHADWQQPNSARHKQGPKVSLPY